MLKLPLKWMGYEDGFYDAEGTLIGTANYDEWGEEICERVNGQGWTSLGERLPGEQGQDSEDVLCFLNGHCELNDFEARAGGGWGIRIGFYDAEKMMFRTGGRLTPEVTHWRELPPAPSLS